jgi:hypothetical protein
MTKGGQPRIVRRERLINGTEAQQPDRCAHNDEEDAQQRGKRRERPKAGVAQEKQQAAQDVPGPSNNAADAARALAGGWRRFWSVHMPLVC